MSIEFVSVLIAVLAVAATLAGLILTSNRVVRLDGRIKALESRLDSSIMRLESRFDAMEHQFGELRERMAHLEGLREAITGRAAAS